jgi:NAD(P)-dependent dehydrogenase (short-subunit alcohol dehydrogenase family)
MIVKGNVGDFEDCGRAVRQVEAELGPIDVLVNNAGITRDAMLHKMTPQQWNEVIYVNLASVFHMCRHVIEGMRERAYGRIINISSINGQKGQMGQTNYSAAKAGIVGMTRTWSMECAKAGIGVNAVIPVAATAMTATIPAFAPHVEAYEERGEPLPAWLRQGEGFGTADDVAGLVVFLASDAADGITGQAIGVGGDRLTLWTHPEEQAAVYREGGWDADAIAGVWGTSLGRHPETVGIPAPVDPAGAEGAGR